MMKFNLKVNVTSLICDETYAGSDREVLLKIISRDSKV